MVEYVLSPAPSRSYRCATAAGGRKTMFQQYAGTLAVARVTGAP